MHNRYLVGVEIGVAAGENAEYILKTLKIKKLYLVDPYEPYFENGVKKDFSESFKTANRRLSKFKQKVKFIKKTSEDAVNDIPDGVHFVYIDGCHDYGCVKRDIELYFPKVKKGGVMGGHDFCTYHLGVVKAVMEFVIKSNLTIFAGDATDWWIIKN